MTVHIQQHKPSFLQTLLQNNASAAFLNGQLSETEWRVSDVSGFLSKASEDQRPTGSAYTWRDVFNETDQAIQTISSFMEVSVLVQDASKSATKKENQYSKNVSRNVTIMWKKMGHYIQYIKRQTNLEWKGKECKVLYYVFT